MALGMICYGIHTNLNYHARQAVLRGLMVGWVALAYGKNTTSYPLTLQGTSRMLWASKVQQDFNAVIVYPLFALEVLLVLVTGYLGFLAAEEKEHKRQ